MNIKIQGGGKGVYANSGSSAGVAKYLTHEENAYGFFRGQESNIPIEEVVTRLDGNKAKLCKDDAKFFVISISPSADEIRAMGNTDEERQEGMRRYVDDVMNLYAQSFNCGLTGADILYYARIHTERKKRAEDAKEGGQRLDLHAHVIISRKDIQNKKKLSPMTNIRDGARSGTVKRGFDRNMFYALCEDTFDKTFQHRRDLKDSYVYLNIMKNGSAEQIYTANYHYERLRNEAAAKESEATWEMLRSSISSMDFSGVEEDRGQDQDTAASVTASVATSLADGILSLFSAPGGYAGGTDPTKKKKKRGMHL